MSTGDIEDTSERLLAVARAIIDETGDFELSMRALAARARVSLTTAYNLFGSKGGVIEAILRADQSDWLDELRTIRRDDPFELLFEQTRQGVGFLERREAFYRALFRATGPFGEPRRGDVLREVRPGYVAFCRLARSQGVLGEWADLNLLAETLTNIYAASLRHWANGGFPIRRAGLVASYGYALALAGAASAEGAAALRAHMAEFAAQINAFDAAAAQPSP